jgi:hypothetical protein
MTLNSTFGKACAEWVAANPGSWCLDHNGRRKLSRLYLWCYPQKTKTQANRAVSDQVRKIRGIVRPKLSFRPLGAPTSQHPSNIAAVNATGNPKWNPVNNPVQSTKLRIARLAENKQIILADPSASLCLVSKSGIQREVAELWCKARSVFGFQSLSEFILQKEIIFYFGITKRSLKDEAFRWLTKRGMDVKGQKGRRNRPVLQWPNGRVITQKEAEGVLGGRSEFLYFSKLRRNCALVEAELQKATMSLPLGKRLHRHACMGKFEDQAERDGEDYLCKVFVTWFKVESHQFGRVIINGYEIKVVA